MALWELAEFVTPRFLGFVRNIPVPEQFQGNRWLPPENVDDIEVEVIKGARERRVMAKVIAYEAETPIGPRPGLGEKIRLSLPPIKLKERIGEQEIIRFKQPRAGTADQQTAIRAVYDTTTRLVQSIFARVEWLQLQALSEPTLAYNDNGVIFAIDYGIGKQWDLDVDAELSTYWDDHVNSDPVADIGVMRDFLIDTYGVAPAELVVSRAVLAHILANEKARALLRGTGTPVAQAILSDEELSRITQLYNLPTIRTYDVQVENEAHDGTISTVRTMASNRAFLVPDTSVGSTPFGPTAEAISDLVGTTLGQFAPGVIAKTYGQEDPPSEWVKAAAVALPSLPSAELVQQVKVLA